MIGERDRLFYDRIENKVILSIGNNFYSDTEKYGELKKCSFDAKSIYDIFMEQPALKGDKEKSILLCSGENAKITRELVLEKISQIIENVAEKETLIIYYSGHGEEIDNEFAMVLYDSDSKSGEGYIKFSEITEKLDRCKAKDKIVILDACFSGLVLQESQGMKVSRKSLEKLIDVSRGVTVLASSKGNQGSNQKSPTRNSLFTHFLMQILRGDVAAQRNYILSVFSLYEYAAGEMVEYCRNSGMEEQVAAITCSSEGIPIIGNYKFRNSDSWYKDNYAKIYINNNPYQYMSWLDDLTSYVIEELWNNVKRILIEFAINAFFHGNATQCEISIHKTRVEFSDNGEHCNQFQKCKDAEGGASIELRLLKKFEDKDVRLEYEYQDNNYHKFYFVMNEAFDITDKCTIHIEKNNIDFKADIKMPECICKYYFLDLRECAVISFQKKFVEDAKRKLPQGSKLVLMSGKHLQGYYREDRMIEFEF